MADRSSKVGPSCMLVIQTLGRTTEETIRCHIRTSPLVSLCNSQAIKLVSSCKVVETSGIQLGSFKADNYLLANQNMIVYFDTSQIVEPQVCCNKLLHLEDLLMVKKISFLDRLMKGLIREFGIEH